MAADPPTSLTLLQRARANDQEAWQRLMQLYTPLIGYWCGQRGVQGNDAEDVCQEVFQAVAAGLAAFRHDRPGDTFRGWLRGITRNKVLDFYRRRNHAQQAQGGTDANRQLQQIPEPPLDTDDPPEELSGLYHRALEMVRSEFEERTWQAFWRATVDGQAPADIAADMGVSAAAVRKAKSRVLRRLKEEVGDVIS